MNKNQTVGKICALIFFAIITVMTLRYFSINKESLDPGYYGILVGSVSANLIVLLIFILQNMNWKYRINFWGITSIMLIGALSKAILPRNIPGKTLNDYFVLWNFNEAWTYWTKVLWHFSIDFTVLCMVVILLKFHRVIDRMNT